MIIRALAVAATVGLALPAPAQSGPPPEGPPGGHGGHDEQIFLSPAGEPFRAPPEAPYPVAAWFAGADTDHDGALTPGEMAADFNRFFDRVDADHDGVVDGFEVADYETRIAPEVTPRMYRVEEEEEGGQERMGGPGGRGGGGRRGRGGGHARGGGGGAAGVDGAAAYSLLNIPEPVSSADHDFDGKVSRAEFAAAARSRFKILDKNADGRLTLAELPLTRVQRLATERPKPPKRGLFGQRRPER